MQWDLWIWQLDMYAFWGGPLNSWYMPSPCSCTASLHDDVMTWKDFPYYCTFVREIYMSPVDPPYKGSVIWGFGDSLLVWTSCWTKIRVAGILRRVKAHALYWGFYPSTSASLVSRNSSWSPVNSPHKGQWHGALMFSVICAWITVE